MSEQDVTRMFFTMKNGIDRTGPLIKEIEKMRQSKLVVLFCGDEPIDNIMCYRLLKLLRRLGNVNKLDLFIESGGGDIDASCKLVKNLKQHFGGYSVLVPYGVKSAATLVAINADEIVMCKAGELGVADPMVREPITNDYVPAHSIKEAIDFIEEVKDPYVKLSLADKLPPLLIGAFRDAQNASKQYIEEALEKLGPNKNEAIHLFTEKYLSHGYPIDRDSCKQVALNVIFPEEDLEKKMGDLIEIYVDLMLNMIGNFGAKAFSVMQTDSNIGITLSGRDITSGYKAFETSLESERT